MNYGRSIAVAGNQSTTSDLTRALLDAGYEISYLISVGPEKKHMIADYVDLTVFAREHGIELIRPVKYGMQDEGTKSRFEGRQIDLLIVVGWQRLIPEWLLDRLSIGAFGMHGSAEPLPRGRGRSPMVWSIIEGRDRFLTNLFRYDPGVDSGSIVATQRFDICAWDTIQSLQHKNALAQERLLLRHLPELLTRSAKYTPQPTDVQPTYYPKRVPDHGVLDWSDRTERIDHLVRAVTRPYPGAFTFEDEARIFIWRGQPFDQHLRFDEHAPGTVVAVFSDRTFLVKTGDQAFYVTDWEAPEGWQPRFGVVFRSEKNPSWEMLARMAAGEPQES